MRTIDIEAVTERLAAVLAGDRLAKHVPATPEDNPLGQATLDDLIQSKSILKHADLLPQQDNKTGAWLGGSRELNEALVQGMKARKDGRQDRRTATAKARRAKQSQIEKLFEDPTPIPEDRMEQGWLCVAPILGIVHDIAMGKARYAMRLTGRSDDCWDVASTVRLDVAVACARQPHFEFDLLRTACQQLGKVHERTGRLPGDQRDADQRKQAKREARARRWVMSVVNNRAKNAVTKMLADLDDGWESLDMLIAVAAAISGAGADPIQMRVSRQPLMLGSRFPRADSVDPAVIAMAISGWITHRRLDPLVEYLLDEHNQTDSGFLVWKHHAEQVFALSPEPDADFKWQLVSKAVSQLADPQAALGKAAREYVRNLFADLPGITHQIIDACNPERVGWRLVKGNVFALIASDFDPDSFDAYGNRQRSSVIRPMLGMGDVAEVLNRLADLIEAHDA